VDLALDLVAVVVDDKNVGRETLTEDGADLLERQLEGAIADKKDRPALVLALAGGHRSAKHGADRPADRAPERLGERHGRLGIRDIEDACDGGPNLWSAPE
jgi:hypothetical protein